MSLTNLSNDEQHVVKTIKKGSGGKLLYGDGNKWFTMNELSMTCGLSEVSIRRKLNKGVTVAELIKEYGNYGDIVRVANELNVSVYTLKKLIRVKGMSLEEAIECLSNRTTLIFN